MRDISGVVTVIFYIVASIIFSVLTVVILLGLLGVEAFGLNFSGIIAMMPVGVYKTEILATALMAFGYGFLAVLKITSLANDETAASIPCVIVDVAQVVAAAAMIYMRGLSYPILAVLITLSIVLVCDVASTVEFE